jgi:hypothetical protein
VEVGGFDPVDQLARYVRWYREGHMSSNGKCFDIGNATRQALHRFELEGEAFPGDADVNAAGNGVLMKLAPVPMAFLADPRKASPETGAPVDFVRAWEGRAPLSSGRSVSDLRCVGSEALGRPVAWLLAQALAKDRPRSRPLTRQPRCPAALGATRSSGRSRSSATTS